MTSEDPRFSDEDGALILQRAAELQAQQGRELSLGELESAAAEAGIDTALVRRAAAEMAVRPPAMPTASPRRGGALGAPLQLLHERVLPGALTDRARDDAIREIRRQLGTDGRVEVHGHELVWSEPRGRKRRVSLAPRAGGWIIRVEERLGELGGGLFLGMALPMTFAGLGFILPICIAVFHMPVLIPVALALWAALSFGLARTIFKTIARQRDDELRALADGLEEVCRGAPALPPVG